MRARPSDRLKPMPREIAQSLAELEAKGWTLTAIAEALDCKLLAVYRWRDGNAIPEDPVMVLEGLAVLSQQRPPGPSTRRDRLPPER